jgi:hypothetical protein
VSLTLNALIKAAAAQKGKPHPAEEIWYIEYPKYWINFRNLLQMLEVHRVGDFHTSTSLEDCKYTMAPLLSEQANLV